MESIHSRVSCGVQRKVKIFKSNFQFLRRFIMRLTGAWKESEFLTFCECIPSLGTSFSSQQTGVTMTRQWSAGVVQSCCNHYQWSNVMWWENSFSIPSICYTDHSHCSEVFTWTLSDEVVSSSCRYEWEAERSWSCVQCCELYWYWVLTPDMQVLFDNVWWYCTKLLAHFLRQKCPLHFHTLTIW